MAGLDIALTLPGEGSLGAFEAGAVAALLVARQEIARKATPPEDPNALNVDAMIGASSGALTAVLASGALLSGQDPVAPLWRAWVLEPSLGALVAPAGRAPLSLDRAREVGHALLGEMLLAERTADANEVRAKEQVTLEFALTCLRGFTYDIHQLPNPGSARRGRSITATSYFGWSEHTLKPDDAGGLSAKWSAALDAAIASASDPLVFPPKLLNRWHPRGRYKNKSITNLPKPVDAVDEPQRCEELWYSDGGLVDREPLGRCVRLVRRLDAEKYKAAKDDRARVVIVIRPRAERAPASSDAAWTGAGGEPRWRTTLARAYRIMTTHSVYEDLRRIEKTNNRVVWANDLVSKLTDLLETHPDARSTLGEFADQISAQRETWNDPNRAPTDRATSELLKYVVRAATGVEQKRTIDVELVAAPDSPRLAGGARGFLAERLRASDFLVGYQQTVEWMETGLTEYPLPRNLRELGVNEARDRATSIPGWTGGVSVSRRTAVKGSAKLVRAGLRAGRVGLRELRVPRQPSR